SPVLGPPVPSGCTVAQFAGCPVTPPAGRGPFLSSRGMTHDEATSTPTITLVPLANCASELGRREGIVMVESMVLLEVNRYARATTSRARPRSHRAAPMHDCDSTCCEVGFVTTSIRHEEQGFDRDADGFGTRDRSDADGGVRLLR